MGIRSIGDDPRLVIIGDDPRARRMRDRGCEWDNDDVSQTMGALCGFGVV